MNLIRTANLKIDRKAVEAVPEIIAICDCVLPLGWDGDVLRVALGRRDSYTEVIERLEFVLGCRVSCFVADFDRIKRAVDEVYLHQTTEIENCPIDFQFQCPKRWIELRPTGVEAVRFCESCSKEVHLCESENELMEQSRLGHCVAVFRQEEVGFMGLIEMPTVKEPERLPNFLQALQSVEDPWVCQAAIDGEATYLETKVFDQDYFKRVDRWILAKHRTEKDRAQLRRFRDALRPHAGKPLLSGSLSFDGWKINAWVEEASGSLVHYEVNRPDKHGG